MAARARVPALRNPNIVIRLAANPAEIEAANWLVYRNYVAEGFWDEDLNAFHNNRWLHNPHRRVFVAMDGDTLLGTASLIRDSELGLPSDSFQPAWMQRYRREGDRLGEISALAFDKDQPQPRNLVLFMIAYYMQYSFYYGGVDRLIKACKPEHAEFYADVLRFDLVGDIVYNSYARRASRMLSMHLIDGHRILRDHYRTGPGDAPSFYRFLLVDEHPQLRLPDASHKRRSRAIDWAAVADQYRLPVAV